MTPICQLDQYTAVVSEITGRTIYINDAKDQFLVSPALVPGDVSKIAIQWLARVDALPVESRPTPGLRTAAVTLASCRARGEVAAALQTLLVTEFQDKLATSAVAHYQRFLVELMLKLWACGAVAWPAQKQVPFSTPHLKLRNPGFTEQVLSYLTKVRSYTHVARPRFARWWQVPPRSPACSRACKGLADT